MASIEKRLKQIAYKEKSPMGFYRGEALTPKSEDIVFLICEELKKEDFQEPFFKGVVNLGDGFKFLSYCGKDQRNNLSKNALVVQKKLSKNNKVLYRVYLMDKDKAFNIRDLFKGSGFNNGDFIGEHNGYNLSPSYYIKGGLKETYEKKELIYIINQIREELISWSLKQ